jgi:hypothetical protein
MVSVPLPAPGRECDEAASASAAIAARARVGAVRAIAPRSAGIAVGARSAVDTVDAVEAGVAVAARAAGADGRVTFDALDRDRARAGIAVSGVDGCPAAGTAAAVAAGSAVKKDPSIPAVAVRGDIGAAERDRAILGEDVGAIDAGVRFGIVDTAAEAVAAEVAIAAAAVRTDVRRRANGDIAANREDLGTSAVAVAAVTTLRVAAITIGVDIGIAADKDAAIIVGLPSLLMRPALL